MTHAEYFSDIYKNKIWGDGSGGGSTPEATVKYRALIQWFLKRYNIKSVIDFGCGDWAFSHLIDWSKVNYTGIDCVPAVVASNKKRFKDVEFIESETLTGTADLLLVKDVLQHWNNSDMVDFLTKAKGFKFILITNDCYQRKDWQDLKAGHRALSARFEPLKQFKPEILLKSNHKETCLIRGDS